MGSLSFSQVSSNFTWVLLGFIGFYRFFFLFSHAMLLQLLRFSQVSQNFTEFYSVLLDLLGYFPDFVPFSWIFVMEYLKITETG